jgi:hypothetical protein
MPQRVWNAAATVFVWLVIAGLVVKALLWLAIAWFGFLLISWCISFVLRHHNPE